MSTGVIKDSQSISGILNLPTNINMPMPTALPIVVNAIDTTEIQTVTKTEDIGFFQLSDAWYKNNDGSSCAYIVKSGRSNYTINGEPAEVITIPAMETNSMGETVNYPETLGLESATWTMAYYPYDSYSGVIWYYKNGSGYYDSQIHVGYDEEVKTTTTTIDTPLNNILAAIGEGKDVICRWNNLTLRLAEYTAGQFVEFSTICGVSGNVVYHYRIYYSFDGVTAQKRRFTTTVVS